MTEYSKEDQELLMSAVAASAATVNLAEVQRLADAQVEAEEKVAEAEEALCRAQAELDDIALRRLPELMDAAGTKEVRTTTGLVVTVKETIRASIPKAREGEALVWLRDTGHAALITRTVQVKFGRGEDEEAAKALESLRARGLVPSDKSGVNPMTLAAFVREQLSEGKDVPLDLFGVFRQRAAKVTKPKS